MRCLKHFAATSAATRSLAEQLISSPVNTTARALLRLNTHTHTNGYALAHGENGQACEYNTDTLRNTNVSAAAA